MIQSRVNYCEDKPLSISLYTEHQRDDVLWAGGKQAEESFEDGETVGKREEGGGWSEAEGEMHKLSI